MSDREAAVLEREQNVAEDAWRIKERERQLEALACWHEARERALDAGEQTLSVKLAAIDRKEAILTSRKEKLSSRLASLAMREVELANQLKQVELREADVLKRANEVVIEFERNEAMREELEKLELEIKQTELGQAATTNPHTGAYHVQSGTTASKFQAVIDGVATRSGIPAERFVSAEPEHTYPLVLLFVKPSGPRLADGVVKYDEVELCRTMVAPGGSLLICTMRSGNDPQAAKDLPAGCPPVEGLLDFCYISGSAQQPHVLNPSSKMNAHSATELGETFKLLVPPPPPPPPPPRSARWRLFQWL